MLSDVKIKPVYYRTQESPTIQRYSKGMYRSLLVCFLPRSWRSACPGTRSGRLKLNFQVFQLLRTTLIQPSNKSNELFCYHACLGMRKENLDPISLNWPPRFVMYCCKLLCYVRFNGEILFFSRTMSPTGL